ncbi:16S rRNA (cytidine(1402)-2'-O)-methyltransferase [Ningiella sp. W23]|uniref:16S rRNA (cytidine(1402)-2'-O)-methyltransferase n=1 Tax=Ningiella sp. W23 TaxID=3023715 RepID=UPI003757EB35
MPEQACLYIVPTPIGNLSDISHRALGVLTDVDLIAAEDTRHSARLLHHYNITTRTISLHTHNESARSALLIEKLLSGTSVALISDAGTPLISDPGFTFVAACRREDIKVIALPGPCALTTALSASGLPTDVFTFFGFLPVKQQAKQNVLEHAAYTHHTAVFYEAPRRIKATVDMCMRVLPASCHFVLAKEISKTFETYISGSAQTLLDYLNLESAHEKGEFVLMLHLAKEKDEDLPIEAIALLDELGSLLPPKRAAAVVSKHYKVNKKQLYEFALKAKES